MPNYYKSKFDNMSVEKLIEYASGSLSGVERAEWEHMVKALARKLNELKKVTDKF